MRKSIRAVSAFALTATLCFAGRAAAEEPQPGTGTIRIGQALQHFSGNTRGMSRASGYGNIDYWVKTATDIAILGRAQGAALSRIAALSPAHQAKIGSVAGQLSAMSEAGQGNLNYWSAKATALRGDLRRSQEQLEALSGLDGQVPADRLVLATTGILRDGISAKGNGNIDYWIRSCSNAACAANDVGRTVSALAPYLASGQQKLVLTYGRQLQEISAKGYGNIDYWAGRTSEVVSTSRKLGDAIDQVVSSPLRKSVASNVLSKSSAVSNRLGPAVRRINLPAPQINRYKLWSK